MGTAEIPLEAIVSEWRPAPLGLGRTLWSDIDRHLEFFAIAREGPAARPD